MVDLIKLICFILLVTHYMACVWHYIGSLEGNGWINLFGFEDTEWKTRYIASLYWSTITTLTVGYGDITAVTDLERVFVIIASMLACGVFGYAIN